MTDHRIPAGMTQALNRITEIESRIEKLHAQQTSPSSAPSVFPRYVELQTPPVAMLPPVNVSKPPTAHDEFEQLIADAAEQHHVRPELLRAVIQTESGFNPNAVSHAGAQGLMQLMPSTATELGVTDPFDPRQNVMAGARYLREQLDRFDGDERKALAAYNAGPGAVLRYQGVPPYPETQRYINLVLSQAGERERMP